MNRDFINIYMQEKNIPSGYLKAWYNFDSGVATGSAGVIYNQIHNVSDHYYDTTNGDGDLKSEILAGISIGDNDVISTPGFFDYREMVQISDSVDYNNWTIFLDIDSKRPGLSHANQQDMTGKTKILLSSMETSGDTSGFHIGLNGYNHPFITYASTDGIQYTHTFSKEASNRNLFSFSFNSDGKSLSISKHSPREDYSESFTTNEIKNSNTWTLGGFKEYLNDSTPTTDIRAFDGTMNHFMLFNPSLGGDAEKDFADFLFINGYEKPEIKQTLVGEGELPLTGAYITSGVTGQGVTGYEKVLIDTVDGIPIYKNSGVIGDVSGDIIAYPDQDTSSYSPGAIYSNILDSEHKVFHSSTCLEFFDKKFSFIKNKDVFSLPADGSLYHNDSRHLIQKISDSGFEVRASLNANYELNKVANYNGISGSFILQSGIENGKHINLYRNGLLQRSGTLNEVNELNTDGTGFADYIVLDSRYVYSNDRYNKNDFITYEECSLPNIIGGYDDGEVASYMEEETLYANYFRLNAPTYLNGRDMFFGGMKLMYGVDYTYLSASTAVVFTQGLDRGVFSWVESFDTNETYNVVGNYETGHLEYNINTSLNLMDEIIWLSGIRQQRNVDYIKTADFSVLNSGYKFDNLTENNDIIYNGDTGFFNL